MIYDTIDHIAPYCAISPALAAGLRFLAQTDLNSLPDGPVEIDGQRVFASIQSYETLPANDTPEAHRKYIDIQYVFQGRELVQVAPLSAMEQVVRAQPEKDLWLHRGPTQPLTIGDGRFLVLFPQDAHAPGIALGQPARVRKCVVKVAVE